MLSTLTSSVLLTLACAAFASKRLIAALAVGHIVTLTWITLTWAAWRAAHPGGQLTTFLHTHGLSPALILTVITLTGSVWLAGSAVLSKCALPAGPAWLAARIASKATLGVAVTALLTGQTTIWLPALCILATRPMTTAYLLIGVRHPLTTSPEPLTLRAVLLVGVTMTVLLLLTVTCAAWPTGNQPPLQLEALVKHHLKR